jgi:hypothetical protein
LRSGEAVSGEVVLAALLAGPLGREGAGLTWKLLRLWLWLWRAAATRADADSADSCEALCGRRAGPLAGLAVAGLAVAGLAAAGEEPAGLLAAGLLALVLPATLVPMRPDLEEPREGGERTAAPGGPALWLRFSLATAEGWKGSWPAGW